MKKDLTSFIATIGLVLLGAAVVLGVLVGLLFLFPNMTIMGAKAVKERDTEIVYRDDVLTTAFAQGRFILESTGTQIEVRMSNEGYAGEGTIVVRESATGIAFNSLSRTLIQWTETTYNDLPYYRIKVLEPSGVVFNEKPTTVYINLPHRDITDDFVHDFVLQNQYSNLKFSYVDNSVGQTDALKIGSLIVESAASVNIPSNTNTTLGSVDIRGNNLKFYCQSAVSGDVNVLGANGEQIFNTIGGSVKIKGDNNVFRGDTIGNCELIAPRGNLSVNNVESLKVTSNAIVNVGTVVDGVDVASVTGSLKIEEVENGGVEFTAGYEDQPGATASVCVNSVVGNVVVDNYGQGSVTFANVDGNVTVNNLGVGAVNLSDVDGDVYVKSTEVGGGQINVGFKKTASNRSVTIRGYDGNINVQNINGKADIVVRDWQNGAGAANITAHFNKVVGDDNVIKTGGYISSHNDWGNVTIKVNSDKCNNFNLFVYGASSANSSDKYGFVDNNMYIIKDETVDVPKGNQIIVNDSDVVSGAITVNCYQSVYLY